MWGSRRRIRLTSSRKALKAQTRWARGARCCSGLILAWNVQDRSGGRGWPSGHGRFFRHGLALRGRVESLAQVAQRTRHADGKGGRVFVGAAKSCNGHPRHSRKHVGRTGVTSVASVASLEAAISQPPPISHPSSTHHPPNHAASREMASAPRAAATAPVPATEIFPAHADGTAGLEINQRVAAGASEQPQPAAMLQNSAPHSLPALQHT